MIGTGLFGLVTAMFFGCWAYYVWFFTMPSRPWMGVLWLLWAVSLPIVWESARRHGLRHHERGAALRARLTIATLVGAGAVIVPAPAVWALGEVLQL